MTTIDFELSKIINKAYSVFNYSTPEKIENVCTKECCMDINDVNLLLTLELNKIPIELIHSYNDNAQAFKINMNEYKYFLPRYLELISQFQFTSCIDVSLSLKNLNLDKNEFWNDKDELNCINDFMLFFFRKCLLDDSYFSDFQLIDVINMFYIAGTDISNLLNIWLNDIDNFSIIHIEQLITNNFNYKLRFKPSLFINKNLSLKIENWINNNREIFLASIENHILYPRLDESYLIKLNYLYDNIKYL
jgi:hypothetical protein